MRWTDVRVQAIVLALMLAIAAWADGALAADAGEYAPENIAKTYKQLGWLCMVRALCPVSDDVYGVIKRAIAGNPSSEYLLGAHLADGERPAERPKRRYRLDRPGGGAWRSRRRPRHRRSHAQRHIDRGRRDQDRRGAQAESG